MINKLILWNVILLIAWGPPASAKTMYTSDITEISVRQGRDTSYPVIATLRSNQPVTVLESSHGWSKIELADGKEGWLISSYLTDKTPGNASAPEAEKKTEQMALQLKGMGEENERLQKEILSLKALLDNSMKNLEDLRAPAEGNPVESEEFQALKAKLDQTTAESKEKTDKIKALEHQLAGAGSNAGDYKCYIYLFLAGAGVLLFGMMIGSSTKRRRSSLL